ncbi:MAG TPA: ABC transporter permease subunit [Candidatus Limnocylindrales bacterium]|nr:ABC transporter permease subunit [Candidatus Limnocylindrales bacterium]
MRGALIIARLTIAEAARRRIVWVLLGLTLVSVFVTTLGVDRLVTLAREGPEPATEIEIQVAVSQILILVAFMFSFVLAMTAAFLGAPAIAADLESGIAHAMLARPIRRADLVVGRWIGLSLIVIAYASLSGLLEVAAVRFVSGYAPPQPWLAVAFLSGQALVLLTLALALSTRLPAIASGAVCVVLFGLGWMAGVFAGIGRVFDAGPLVTAAEATRWLLPSDGLWRGTVYALEPSVVIAGIVAVGGPRAAANPFFALTPPPLEFIGWSVVWIAIVLVLATFSLSRRDL